MNPFRNLTYFVKIINNPLLSDSSTFLVLNKNAHKTVIRFCSTKVVSPKNAKNKTSGLESVKESGFSDHGSVVSKYFNFATYADSSPLIQRYIDLGVNLYEVEKNPEAANFLITLNFEKIKPYIVFLSDNGVPSERLGEFITKNPLIFKEDLDDLEVRINYLRSKKFNVDMISQIITRNPKWLSVPVKKIDERLGFLQQSFNLKGDEIRQMITQLPKLATIKKEIIIINIHALKEEMGLDKYTLKKVVLSEPNLLRIDSYALISTFEYFTKTMQVPTALVTKQPKVLTTRKFILEERHRFLESLGRAQYNNLLPGYVNLLNLVQMTDAEFCEKIAKTSVELFNEFLKTF